MKLNLQIAATTALLLHTVAALALPTHSSEDVDVAKHDHAMASIYAKGNLSSLFGWQLVGSRMTQSEQWSGCHNMSPKWEAIGLDTDSIKGPLCNGSTSYLRPGNIMPFIDHFVTNIFISQLLSTFNSTDAYAHLCNNIGFNMVSSFGINDLSVVEAVCDAADEQTEPRPEATLPWATNGAVQAARNTASILFSIIWAAAATSDSQLNIACARAPNYTPHLNNEHLNGTLVQSTLCSFQTPLSVRRAHDLLKTWMSRLFTTVLENVDQGGNWLVWLCSNVDPGKLNAAGLYGYGIQSQVCDDSKEYSGENRL